ncbi:hypothetical protein V2G26_019508 [Clonostachys chloroleuca]
MKEDDGIRRGNKIPRYAWVRVLSGEVDAVKESLGVTQILIDNIVERPSPRCNSTNCSWYRIKFEGGTWRREISGMVKAFPTTLIWERCTPIPMYKSCTIAADDFQTRIQMKSLA